MGGLFVQCGHSYGENPTFEVLDYAPAYGVRKSVGVHDYRVHVHAYA